MMRIFVALLMFIAVASAQQPRRVIPEAGANLPSQTIGSNDLVSVTVYDAPELSRTIRIGPDGYMRLPMLKQRIKAEGLNSSDLETVIAKALQEEEILVDPFVTITMAEYHSRPITIAGAVKVPLQFQAEGPTKLLEVIARAQGLTADAGPEILVSRTQAGPDGKPVSLVRRVRVRDLIDNADPDLNLTLTGGEEIRVPEVSRIYVFGNVKKPNSYKVQDGSTITVMQLLALAEGLAPFYSKTAYIYRKEGAGAKNEIPVALDKIMKRQAPDVPLLANDIFYVPDNSGKRLALAVLEKVVTFGTTAASTALIYGTIYGSANNK